MLINLILQLDDVSREILTMKDITVPGILLLVCIILSRIIFILIKKLDDANSYSRDQDKENIKVLSSLESTVNNSNDTLSNISEALNKIKEDCSITKGGVEDIKRNMK